MALIGSSSKKTTAAPGIRIKDIQDQLDTEWANLKQDSISLHGEEESGLLAYYQCAARLGIHWVAGDPYTFQFPEAYQGERLAKLCAYLIGLKDADPALVKQAREHNLKALRVKAWPAYRDMAVPPIPQGMSMMNVEILPFNWEGLERLWNGETHEVTGTSVFLPAFQFPETADFHLATLAVLYLNRQLRYALTDLYAHSTGGN
ncbi:hypothetical protein [Deinococcus aquatilis]|uniref:hypothetical protein n=1 Tax=Deinococcus aquatilis TaxID=519440 RepID=UPI0003743227|nr:hypothetical protein [Deinococcus aquatilis]